MCLGFWVRLTRRSAGEFWTELPSWVVRPRPWGCLHGHPFSALLWSTRMGGGGSRVLRTQTDGRFPGSGQESGDWKVWGRKAFRGRDSVDKCGLNMGPSGQCFVVSAAMRTCSCPVLSPGDAVGTGRRGEGHSPPLCRGSSCSGLRAGPRGREAEAASAREAPGAKPGVKPGVGQGSCNDLIHGCGSPHTGPHR